MCGIAGIIDYKKPVIREMLGGMVDLIRHRGPDDFGYFAGNNVALGHCRLSIIDLSPAGHQPMANEDGSLQIVFNGEIYNHAELRGELEKLGHTFKSGTDTEVIIHAYEEWRKDCLARFNGEWAFAIWDVKRNELFCARDRFGIKPFYYFKERFFAFCSEIKPLLGLLPRREANDELIYDFLRFGMLDHTDATFFKEIKKLPPAHCLTVNSKQAVLERYWDLEVCEDLHGAKSDEFYAQDFLELFNDAVKIRLKSDVPLGTCLSGGMDSSSIVCTIANFIKKEKFSSVGDRQKIFSACFGKDEIDETEYIDEVARATGVEKNFVFPQQDYFVEKINDFIISQEEPFAGAGICSQWMVMEKAKSQVKILLDGQGADESLCGYRKFYLFYFKKLLADRNYGLLLNESARFFSSSEILKTLNLKKGVRYFPFLEKKIYPDNLLRRSFSDRFTGRKLDFNYNGGLGARIKDDITKWSLPVLLRYEDKNSMAHSIESRLPFLDHRLVEKMAAFPIDQKMKNGYTKFVLRNAMKNILPEKIRTRKSKIGFSAPDEKWIKSLLGKEMRPFLSQGDFLANYANNKELVQKFDEFGAGKNNLTGNIFFRFYILEKWGRQFFS